MGAEGENPPGSVLNQHIHCFAQRARGVHHIVHENHIAAFHGAHQIHPIDLVGFGPLLDDHRQTRVHLVLAQQAVAELLGAKHTTRVRGYNHRLHEVHIPEIGHSHGETFEIVHGYAGAEKALNLAAVQIHRHHSIYPHGLQQTRHVGRRDGHSRLHFAVLSGVSIVRDHGGDFAGGSATSCADHQQQLHETFVHWWLCRLHQVHILTTNVLVHLYINFSISKAANFDFSQWNVEMLYNFHGQFWVCCATEQLDALRQTSC
mmetsp:Transcript_12252/g.20330  ORF Transcript_12252/g.20330 Transcript_12252/m.20330 type:complete len:261 (-) Transcript_12252:319-1101(-)